MSKYYDGKTSKSQTLDVEIAEGLLIGKNTAGEQVIAWSVADIHVVNLPDKSMDAVVTNSNSPDARLYLNHSQFNRVRPLLGNESIPPITISTSLPSIAFWALLATIGMIIFYYLFLFYLPIIAKKIPHEWEKEISESAIESIVADNKYCNNEKGVKAIQKIQMKLTNHDISIPPLKVKVIKNRSINAFAIPGNYIYFYSGLIDNADSAEEFAGVFAHEIGHVIEKHTIQSLVKSTGITLLFNMATGNIASLELFSVFGASLLIARYSREFESEADSIAINLLQKGNINPNGLIAFFEKMKNLESDLETDKVNHLFTFLSTHPSNQERINASSFATNQPLNYNPLLTKDEWASLKLICSTLK